MTAVSSDPKLIAIWRWLKGHFSEDRWQDKPNPRNFTFEVA